MTLLASFSGVPGSRPRMHIWPLPANRGRPEMAGGTLVSRFGRERPSTADGNGAKDSVKRRQTEQIAVVLRDSGVPAEYSLAPNDGNGFARLVNNVEKFLEKHLGRPLSGEWLG